MRLYDCYNSEMVRGGKHSLALWEEQLHRKKHGDEATEADFCTLSDLWQQHPTFKSVQILPM